MTTLLDLPIAAMPPLTRMSDGTALVRGLRIFKVGQFKDSQGRPHTITTDDLSAFASNFASLRASNVLPNVPIRIDHSTSQRSVVGYFENVYTDGEFLFGDIHLTNQQAIADYSAGTLRNRSLEFGSYETNDGTVIKNVVWGCAFVDLPAVEGLFGHGQSGFTVLFQEESPVDLHTFTIKGVGTTDYASVERHIAELEARVAAGPALHTFRVNGGDITDVTAVQAHIGVLETFRAETMNAGRVAFAKQLVADKKIAATQEAATATLVQGLDAAAFEQFKKVYENAPIIGAFAQHAGDGSGGHEGRGTGTPDVLDPVAQAEQVFAMQRASGVLGTDELKALASYKTLVSAGKPPTL